MTAVMVRGSGWEAEYGARNNQWDCRVWGLRLRPGSRGKQRVWDPKQRRRRPPRYCSTARQNREEETRGLTSPWTFGLGLGFLCSEAVRIDAVLLPQKRRLQVPRLNGREKRSPGVARERGCVFRSTSVALRQSRVRARKGRWQGRLSVSALRWVLRAAVCAVPGDGASRSLGCIIRNGAFKVCRGGGQPGRGLEDWAGGKEQLAARVAQDLALRTRTGQGQKTAGQGFGGE